MDWAKILALPYFCRNRCAMYMIFASNPIHVPALCQLLAKNAMFFQNQVNRVQSEIQRPTNLLPCSISYSLITLDVYDLLIRPCQELFYARHKKSAGIITWFFALKSTPFKYSAGNSAFCHFHFHTGLSNRIRGKIQNVQNDNSVLGKMGHG